MSTFGDDGSEMPRSHPSDPLGDDAIDALLSGSPASGSDGLSAFVDDLRAAAGAVPTPSPVLAAAIAAGGISTYQPPVAQWRKFRMKIKGFVAGLGLAGKLALGVGVAAAATTGAGAAGVLPGPVQHAVSKAVGSVSPFSLPDPDHHGVHGAGHDANVAAGDDSTTTTVGDVTTTTGPSGHHDDDNGDDNGKGGGVIVTPTTVGEHHGDGDGNGTAVTTTTVANDNHNGNDDGNGDDNGGGNGNGDDNTTPTTVHHGDGDNNNPQAIAISCAASTTGITCTWTASPNADHAWYVLLRTGDGHGRVITETPDGSSFTDTTVLAGNGYQYRVDSLRADGSVDAHSPLVNVTFGGGDTTTTTTVHHDGGDSGGDN